MVSPQIFSALLPLAHYKIKIKVPSEAYVIEITYLLETAKAYFCRLSSRNPTFFGSSVFFQVTPKLETTKPWSLILAENFFL